MSLFFFSFLDWKGKLLPVSIEVIDDIVPTVMSKKAKTAAAISGRSTTTTTTTTTTNNTATLGHSSIKHKQPANSTSGGQSKKTKPSNSYYTKDELDEMEEMMASYDTDDRYMKAVKDLSIRMLDELRAAKSRHLTCTEVSLPCDLTPNVARDIVRVSEKEPCGIRGCTIYIEFEDEPQNSRRIATIKVDPDTVSTFEVYLTLRQDHRGWTSLLPQFMKSLARTITISPEYTITKNKLYSADGLGARRSYSFGSHTHSPSAAIATPTN